MKYTLPTVASALCSLAFVLPSQAGEDFSSKKVVVVPPASPECSTREFQPLFSRYARTSTQWTLRAGYRSFKDVELQEHDNVDGTTLDFEITMPINDRLQFRLYYPYNTDADARVIATGNKADIDGSGGLLDFPSLTMDYQFKKAAGAGDANMAVYFGLGNVRRFLESTDLTTGVVDRVNHRGSVVLFGFKMDKQLDHCLTFVGNAGGRYYWDSDDLHPNEGGDKFFLVDLSAALIYNPPSAWIFPAVEVVFQGDLSDYSSLSIVPQVIVPLGDHVEVDAGIALGLLDGASTEVRAGLTARF